MLFGLGFTTVGLGWCSCPKVIDWHIAGLLKQPLESVTNDRSVEGFRQLTLSITRASQLPPSPPPHPPSSSPAFIADTDLRYTKGLSLYHKQAPFRWVMTLKYVWRPCFDLCEIHPFHCRGVSSASSTLTTSIQSGNQNVFAPLNG